MSKLRKAAEGQSCVRCGSTGTTILAHYSGLRQHDYGKGKAIKGADVAAAHLCHQCHEYFDQYAEGNTWERSEEFLHLCMMTIIRLFKLGVIKA